MTKEEFIEFVLKVLTDNENVIGASRILGEDVIGVDMSSGAQYFVEIQEV